MITRYFKSSTSEVVYTVYTDLQALNYTNRKDWEEVIVIPKPTPKTWTEELAMFEWVQSPGTTFILSRTSADTHYNKSSLKQLSSWQTITFTEKSGVDNQ